MAGADGTERSALRRLPARGEELAAKENPLLTGDGVDGPGDELPTTRGRALEDGEGISVGADSAGLERAPDRERSVTGMVAELDVIRSRNGYGRGGVGAVGNTLGGEHPYERL